MVHQFPLTPLIAILILRLYIVYDSNRRLRAVLVALGLCVLVAENLITAPLLANVTSEQRN